MVRCCAISMCPLKGYTTRIIVIIIIIKQENNEWRIVKD